MVGGARPYRETGHLDTRRLLQENRLARRPGPLRTPPFELRPPHLLFLPWEAVLALECVQTAGERRLVLPAHPLAIRAVVFTWEAMRGRRAQGHVRCVQVRGYTAFS